MKKDPERKPSTEGTSQESKSSAADEALTEQEVALSETSNPTSVAGQESVPVDEDEWAPEEKRIAQERELDEKLGTEDD